MRVGLDCLPQHVGLCVHSHSTVCLCWQVRLNESQSKNKLYFGNLPRGYTQKQLEDELKKAVKGEFSVDLSCFMPPRYSVAAASMASWGNGVKPIGQRRCHTNAGTDLTWHVGLTCPCRCRGGRADDGQGQPHSEPGLCICDLLQLRLR